MKSAFKFKSGAGAIIAFFLIAVIFSTLIGVVFVSINQSPSKRPEASGPPDPKVPGCIFSPTQVAGGGSVALTSVSGLTGSIMMEGYRSDGRIPLGNLVVNSTVSLTVPVGTVVDEYFLKVENSEILCTTQEGSSLLKVVASNLWNLQNKVEGGKVTFSYSPPANSNAFNAIVVEDAVNGGVVYDSGGLTTGSTSHVWNNVSPGKYVAKMFAFGVALVSNESSFEVVAPGCTISPEKTIQGGKVRVTSVGGLSGSIGMQGAYQTPAYSGLGNLTANGTTTITVPATAQLGLYVVRVGSFGVGCKPDLAVNVPNKCDFNKDNVLNSGDQGLLAANLGKVPPKDSKYDINGDKYINSGDQAILAQAVKTFPTATKYCY